MNRSFHLVLIFCSLFSCESVLDKKPLDIISDDAVWRDKVFTDAYLVQCYAEINFYFEGPYNVVPNTANRVVMHAAMQIADEATLRVPSAGRKSNDITVNGGVFEWWGYPTIRKLNIFIENVELSSFDNAYKSNRLSEARFLRAFAYFNLVKRYGGIPLITIAQEITDSDEELYRKRDKEEDVYDFILTELDQISQILPENNEPGRPSKYAALALKSRTAMYAASIATWGTVGLEGIVGIPQERAKDYWELSLAASEAILNSGKFSLYNKFPNDKSLNFRNIFLDENNSEVIFSQVFNGQSGVGSSFDMLEVPHRFHVIGGGQFSSPYLQMVESFDNIDGSPGMIDRDKISSGYSWTVDELFGKKDPRFKATIYTMGTDWTWQDGPVVLDYHNGILLPDGTIQSTGSYKGVLVTGNSYLAGQASPFGILKYLDEEERALQQGFGFSDTDYIVFRLGEIYINHAEAALELGQTADALASINLIRERAGMPLLQSITRDLIRKERKVELAFEGNRYFDVRRWRTAEEDLSQNFQGIRYILDGTSFEEGQYDVKKAKFRIQILDHLHGTVDPFFENRHYYLPITRARIDNNPNLVENPGWQ